MAEDTNTVETVEQGLADAASDTALATTETETQEVPSPEESAPSTNKEEPADTKPEGSEAPADKDVKQKDYKAPAESDDAIKDWSKVKIDLPEGSPVDQTVLGDFGKAAVELGLTEKQAKALVEFQLEAIAKQKDRLMEAGIKELTKEWGSKIQENQKTVLTFIANIDRELGGNAFSKALDACGATCLPAVCKGLLHIAKSVSEDSMGRGGGAVGADQPESIEDALMKEWKKARGEA